MKTPDAIMDEIESLDASQIKALLGEIADLCMDQYKHAAEHRLSCGDKWFMANQALRMAATNCPTTRETRERLVMV